MQSLACQSDKYNVSPIKTSLPVSNSAAALLTAARQGGCAGEPPRAPLPPPGPRATSTLVMEAPGFPFLKQQGPFLWHVNKTFTPPHVSPPPTPRKKAPPSRPQLCLGRTEPSVWEVTLTRYAFAPPTTTVPLTHGRHTSMTARKRKKNTGLVFEQQ